VSSLKDSHSSMRKSARPKVAMDVLAQLVGLNLCLEEIRVDNDLNQLINVILTVI